MSNTTWIEFVAFDELVTLMAKASSVLCHAGVGTIMTSLQNGHTPVVIPRQARLGEHVDDHQMDIANRFAERGLIHCVTGDEDLEPLLTARADPDRGRIGGGSEELRRRVSEAVDSSAR
jgi:UDP-N-acetylglucosamine transferase subunit ALG13